MEVWRLIEDGTGDGAMNMATDRAILTACGEGKAPPTLRLYGWQQPTVTTGYSQNSVRDLDMNRCRSLGIPVVSRPTGGRALLHDKELTYSLVAPIPHAQFPSNLRDAFQMVSEALLLALGEMGIQDAAMANTRRVPMNGRSPSCFSSLNHCEITVNNKKLIGSAQRRKSGSFLQHGSLWMDCDRELMNSLFRFDLPQTREANLKILERNTITLKQLFGREVRFEEVAQAFQKGFQSAFPVKWERGELSVYEMDLRDRFLNQKGSLNACE
jgi:lipoyl(octanoyl) transferase